MGTMFTGIVEETGIVREIDLDAAGGGLRLAASVVLPDTHLGNSIAVNGVCLTVTSIEKDCFTVGVMPETLRRTALGDLHPGDEVNLERSLQPTSRMGGHFVQGHVDGTGLVASVKQDGNALAVRIEADTALLRYVVEKGYIAVDGASLTVTDVDAIGFGLALIPYTQQHIAPRLSSTGCRVNLEVDILAKYLEKLVVH